MDWLTSGGEDVRTVYSVDKTGSNPVSPIIDMRGFAGFYVNLEALLGVASTAYNDVQLVMNWYDQELTPTNTIFVDRYTILAAAATGTFPTNGGLLMGQDNVHGPFLQMYIISGGAQALNVRVIATVIGTTRVIPYPLYKESGALIANFDSFEAYSLPPTALIIPAAGVARVTGYLRYGGNRLHYQSLAAMTFTVTAAGQSQFMFLASGAAAGSYELDINYPKATPIFAGSSAGAGYTINLVSTADYSKQM